MQRNILRAIERQDYSGAFAVDTKPVRHTGDCSHAYVAQTAALFSADPACTPEVMLVCENSHILSLVQRIFERAGIIVRTEGEKTSMQQKNAPIRVKITPDGEKCFVSAGNSAMDEVLRQIMCAWTLIRMGEKRLILGLNATRAIESLCERENAEAVYIAGDKSAWHGAMAEESRLQFALQTDGAACALCFISALAHSGMDFIQWKNAMPGAYRSFRRIPMDEKQVGAALHSLFESRSDAQLGGGIRLNDANGWAWISPDDVQPEMCVMAESARHETADELCFFYADRLEKLIKNHGD